MTRKLFLKKGFVLCAGAMLCLLFCSNPTKQTLKWRTTIELPVSNASFVIGQEFQNLFGAIDTLKDFAILGTNDTTVEGDTTGLNHCIAFSKINKDTFSFQQKQDSMGNKTFEVNLGPLPLSSAGDISTRVSFGVTGTLPADVRQTVTSVIALPKIHRLVIDYDPANGQLPLSVSNGTAATIDSVRITLANVLPSAPSQFIGALAPGASVNSLMDVTGEAIDSTLQIRVSAVLKAGGTIAVGSGLDVSISLSGVKAASAIVMDSLLGISDTFTNNYKITDSMDMDYADIQDGFFNYMCDNSSGIDLFISAEHHDLWITPACISRNVTRQEDIQAAFAASADSFNYYSGNIIDGDRKVEARQNKRFARLNLSGNRMFPKWIDSNSVTRVDYFVRTEPRGNWDTVNKMDALIFTIQPAAMNYGEMAGTLVKPIDKTSDTQTVEIPFPFPEANKDSLRGAFVLQRVKANMNLKMSLPDSAFIDSMLVNFKVLSPTYPDSLADTNVTFGTLKKDTVRSEEAHV